MATTGLVGMRRARGASAMVRRTMIGAAAAGAAFGAQGALAHTDALGFIITSDTVNIGKYVAQIYYGTYNHGGTPSAEGSAQITINGSVVATSPFALVPNYVGVANGVIPPGLVIGTNYFFVNSSTGGLTTTPYGSGTSQFQYATFTDLNPGTYSFGYVAGALTQQWTPLSPAINAGSFTITASGNLGGIGGVTITPNIDTAKTAYTTTELAAGGVNPAFTGGTLTVAGTVAVSNSFTLGTGGGTINTSGNTLTVNGTVANSGTTPGALTVSGGGKVVLSGTNSYSGGTIVNGGVLQLNSTTAAGTGAIRMVDPTLVLNATGTYANEIRLEVPANQQNDPTIIQNTSGGLVNISGQVHETSVAGQYVTFDGGSTQLSNTANSWTGVTRINTGTTLTGNSQTISGGSIVNNGALVYNAGGTVGQAITGNGSLNANAGTLSLTGANNYSGTTTIAANATLQGTTDTISGGSIVDNGTLAIAQGASGSFQKAVSGSGVVTVSGLPNAGNPITFNGALTNAGGLTLGSGGYAILNANLTSSSTAGAVQITGAGDSLTITANHSVTSTQTATLNNASAIYGTGLNFVVNNAGTINAPTVVQSGSLPTYGSNGIYATNGVVVNNTGNIYGIPTSNPTATYRSNGVITFGDSVINNTGAAYTPGTTYANGTLTGATAGGGVITGGWDGVYVTGNGAVYNSGTLAGNVYDGAQIQGNGLVTNYAGGRIVGASTGAGIGGTGTIANSGLIVTGLYNSATNTITSGAGNAVVIGTGGIVNNTVGGTIVGGTTGVYSSGTATIINAGTIGTGTVNGSGNFAVGGAGFAIQIAGGSISNSGTLNSTGASVYQTNASGTLALLNSGTIGGAMRATDPDDTVVATGTATIVNTGLITTPNYYAVSMANGGTLTNAASTSATTGTISAGSVNDNRFAVNSFGTGAVTINNYGILTSTNSTIQRGILTGDAAATINLYAGSKTGAIQTGAGNDTLSIYTGTVTTTANTVADPTSASNPAIVVRAAGTYAAASLLSSVNLGGGTNTLRLRGRGDDGANGAAGNFSIATSTGASILTKLDAGTWTLTGAAITPTLTINAGTGTPAGLLIFDGTTGLTGDINVNGGIIRATGSGAFGTGTIHAIDPEVQYAGGTYTNAISLESTNPSGDPTLLRATGNGSTVTLTGAITQGAGAPANQPLTFSTTGNPNLFVLTNTANSWTGATTIDANVTLQGTAGTAGAPGTISGGSVVDNGTLAFVQTASGTFARNVSGAGGITVSGLVDATGASNGNTLTFAGVLAQSNSNMTFVIPLAVLDSSNVTITGSIVPSAAYTNALVTLAAAGTFTNLGTVSIGVNAQAIYSNGNTTQGGVIDNGSATVTSASLTGGDRAILYADGSSSLTVNNWGLIQSTKYNGVQYNNTGTLTLDNMGSGAIYGSSSNGSGYAGVLTSSGGTLALTNAGAIIGATYGVNGSNAADSIVNAGTIAAGGYTAPAAGGVYSSGTITIGTAGSGLLLNAGGTVINDAGGRFVGGSENNGDDYGIQSIGDLTLTNAAATIDANGTITTAAGKIVGGYAGVEVQGVAAITNSGLIGSGTLDLTDPGTTVTSGFTARGSDGIRLFGGGTVTNNAGAVIESALGSGVYVEGADATIVNAGTIQSANGIFTFGDSGENLTVVNNNGGVIHSVSTPGGGYYVGVYQGGPGQLTVTNNAGGAIVSDGGDAVHDDGSGLTTIVNDGTIVGAASGVGTQGLIDVTNTGLIGSGTLANGTSGAFTAHDQYYGINAAGGIVRNNGGTIQGGGQAGIYSGGALTVTNTGTIATAGTGTVDGITSNGTLTLTNTGVRDGQGNLTGGIITAATASGVAFVGTDSSVVNSGRITGGGDGTYGYGVQAANGSTGAITNQVGGVIEGGLGGIVVRGDSLTIANSGVLRGTGATSYGINQDQTTTLGIANAASGQIVGQTSGINAASNVAITNAGLIAVGTVSDAGAYSLTSTGYAVVLNDGGTIANTGTIRGGGAAIFADGGTLNLTNTGNIYGGQGYAANTQDAVYAANAATILNAGAITTTQRAGTANAPTYAALNLAGGGTVTNAAGGTLAGGTDATYGDAIQLQATGVFNNYGTASGASGALNQFADAATTINLFAGSTTGAIRLAGGDDRVSLYTGRVNAAAVTTTYVDPVTGVTGTVTLQNAGTIAAAAFGAIDLGTGANTLTLRGPGADAAAGGATGQAGTLNLATTAGVTTLSKLGTGTWNVTGAATGMTAGATILAGSGTQLGGQGLLNFTGDSGLTGTIYLNGASVRANGAGTLGTGTIHMVDPTLVFATTSATYANNFVLDVARPGQGSPSDTTNDPSTFSANSGVVATLSGAITTGTGNNINGYAIDANQPVVIAGAGTIALTNGANAWTGVTTINTGATLRGTTASISGSNIVDNGVLNFNATTGTNARAISGTGNVLIDGGGAVTLTGAITAAGGVRIGANSTATLSNVSGNGNTTVLLSGDNAVLNVAPRGTITDTNGGAVFGTAQNGTVNNAGTISSTGFSAVYFNPNTGTNTVNNTGSITGFNAVYSGSTLNLTNNGTLTGQPGTAVFTASGSGAATIVNNGTIQSGSGTTSNGISLNGGGTVTNNAAGLITGTQRGVAIGGASSTVNNYGRIVGGTDNAVSLFAGGNATNFAGGTLTATGSGGWGVYTAGAGTIDNQGTITADSGLVSTSGATVFMNEGTVTAAVNGVWGLGTSVNLTNSGTITGGTTGVRAEAAGSTITNAGTIAGSASGAVGVAMAGGTLLNQSGGTISAGRTNGVYGTAIALTGTSNTVRILAGSTVNGTLDASATTDATGTYRIGGALNGSFVGGSGNDTLTLLTGANVTGTLNGGAGTDTLVLDGTATGTLNAAQVVNFENGVKQGSGTWTLTGTTAASPTMFAINAGTLNVAGGNALADTAMVTVASGATFGLQSGETIGGLAGAGGVTLGANTLSVGTGNGSATFAGVASGTGGLTKLGTGTETLSGTNTYTGATTVSAGTLALGANNAVGAGSAVSVASGATFNLATYNDMVASVAINGTLAGTGTLTAATYALNGATVNANLGTGALIQTGGTSLLNGTAGAATVNVNAGTLSLGASNRLADNAAVAVASGATLNLAAFTDTVGTAALAGTLAGTGTGTLTATSYTLNGATVNANLGTGTLIQAGGISVLNGTANAGAVAVNAGTLRIGAAERIADSANVMVASGATFDLAGYTETVGTLSGMGNVTLGAGTLVTGGTNADYGFGGVVSGSGDLTKVGTGTFTLVGNETMSGRINANAGTLLFVGTTAGGVRVQGGTLTGMANVAGQLAISSGTFSPGTATQAVAGFQAGSLAVTGGTSVFDFTGATGGFTADTIRVSGTAMLAGGTVVARATEATANYRLNNQYLLLQAGALTGTYANGTSFAQANGNPDLYWRLRYDLMPNSVLLEVRKVVDFTSTVGAGATRNQLAVAGALNGATLTGSDSYINLLNAIANQSASAQRATFDSIGGESIADITTSAALMGQRFTDLLRERLAVGGSGSFGSGLGSGNGDSSMVAAMGDGAKGMQQLRAASQMAGGSALAGANPEGGRGSAWVQTFGGAGRLDGANGTAALRDQSYGVAAGLDGRVGAFTLGGAFAATSLDTRVAARTATNQGTLYQGGGYAAYDDGQLYASAIGSYFSGEVDTRRSVFVGGTAVGVATGKTRTRGYTAGGAIGYRADLGAGVRFTPQGAFETTHVVRGAFTETGAGDLSLNVARQNRDLYTATVEGRFSHVSAAPGGVIEPYVGGGAQFNWGDRDTLSSMRFTGAPAGTGAFAITGARIAPVTALVTGGIEAHPNDRVILGAGVETHLSDRQHEARVQMHVRLGF